MSRAGPGPRCMNTRSAEAAPGTSIDAPVRSRTATRMAVKVALSASMVSCLPSQTTVGGRGGFCSAVGGAGGGTTGGPTSCGGTGLTTGIVGLFFPIALLVGVFCACTQDVARSSRTSAPINRHASGDPLEPRNGRTVNPISGICATAKSPPSRTIPV